MWLANTTSRSYWDTLLILGRVSNLPTVWSNCLAGWLLGGGGSLWNLLLLGLGSSCLYLGGMFLNDAFDVEFDRLHRRERPIPSGRIALDSVWQWGFGFLGLGTVLLVLLGNATGAYAALLLFCIVFYDAVHKLSGFAPVLMGLCRCFLYLLAASAGDRGVEGLAIWSGLALGFYVTGLSYLARHERSKSALPRWPVVLLAVPLVLALLVNGGSARLPAFLVAVAAGLWMLRALQPAFMTPDLNVGRSVASLLAGIVVVDLLALAGALSVPVAAVFLVLFLSALALQRTVPAT